MKYFVEICFTAENDPDLVSRGIMLAEGTPYSHVLSRYSDELDRTRIFHSIKGGPQIDTGDYLKTHTIVRAYRVPMRVSREAVLTHIRARCRAGIGYAESQYINQGIRIASRLINAGLKACGFQRRIQKPWQPVENGGEDSICSEEMTELLLLSDVDVSILVLDSVSPLMLDEHLAKQPLAELIIGGPIAQSAS